jgi:hypothetical protein
MDAILTSKEGLELKLDKNKIYIIGNTAKTISEKPTNAEKPFDLYYNLVFSYNLQHVKIIHPRVLPNHVQISYLDNENIWAVIALSRSNLYQSWINREKEYQKIDDLNKFYLQNNDVIILGATKKTQHRGYKILFKEFQGASPKQLLPPNQELNRPLSNNDRHLVMVHRTIDSQNHKTIFNFNN